ncbi:MAG: O-antigen ligase family protein [Baekduia sp.]
MNFFDLRQVGEMTSWVSRMKFRGTLNIGANEVAAFYATYTFILLGLWIFKPKEIKFRPWLMALIACNFFLVLFLFSRGAYAAVLMSLVFVALNRKPLLIVALVFVVLFWQLILPDEIVKRLTFTETEGTLDQSAALRLVYWEMTFNYFLENPIFGIGFNVIQHLIGHDTHNIWLRTLAEQGLLGAFFLVTIFMCAFRQGWFLYRHSRDNFFRGLGFGFCCCVLSMIVGNIFGDRWIHVQLNAFFWVFLGMVERGNFLLPLDEKNYRREGLHRESSRPIRKDWPTEDQVEMK